MTRPVKTGHICTQFLRHFLIFNLILLHTYLMKLSGLILELMKNHVTLELVYYSQRPKNEPFSEYV